MVIKSALLIKEKAYMKEGPVTMAPIQAPTPRGSSGCLYIHRIVPHRRIIETSLCQIL